MTTTTHRKRRRDAATADAESRRLVSALGRRTPKGRSGLLVTNAVLVFYCLVAGVGPILWLAKAAVTPTQDTLQQPMAIWPNGATLEPLRAAWFDVGISHFFLNSVYLALGSWAVQMVVCTTGAFVIAILRPAWARFVETLVLATLFIPSVILLVPLYLTVLDLPVLGLNLLNTFWGVWLPSGTSAFNMLLVINFFRSLPHEIFEAARIDGAGPLRLFSSVVLPMSKPILGVLSIFAIMNSWKDFLWPMLVLPDPSLQPLTVRLNALQSNTPLDTFLAALAISAVIPVVIFIMFQKFFLNGSSLSGAVKG